jgi:conjugal transfer/type IV secretion protein DotA/TraY
VLTAGEAFDRTVEEAAQEMVRTLNTREGEAIVRRAEILGWASAGSINATLVRATARAQEIVGSAAPSANGPDTTQLTRAISNSEARARMEMAMRGIQELGRDILPASGLGGRGVMQSVNLGADLAGNGVLSQVLAPVSHAITRAATDNIGYLDPVRPMASIQQTGTILMTAGGGLAVAYMGARGAAEGLAGQQVASFMGGAIPKGVLEAAGPYVTTMSFALIVMGAVNAYIIPMMHYIMWFFAIFGVIALAVQLVVAAPIAALLHVRADGPELINQEQRTIYVMTFNAFLRPTLLLFGLAFANVVFSVMAGYLNATFGVAVTATNADTIIGLFGFLTITALVLYLHFQLAVRSMQLVTAIPMAVSELLGARDGLQEEFQQSQTVLAGMAGGASRTGQSTATSSIRNLERKPVGGRMPLPGPGGIGPRPAVAPAPTK